MSKEEILKEKERIDHLLYIVLKPGKNRLEFNHEKLKDVLMNIIDRIYNIIVMILKDYKLDENTVSSLENMQHRLSAARNEKMKAHYDKSRPNREQGLISESGKISIKISDLEEFYKTICDIDLDVDERKK